MSDTRPHYARLAASALTSRRVDTPTISAEDRTQSIAVLHAQMMIMRRQRRIRKIVGFSLAAAALISVGALAATRGRPLVQLASGQLEAVNRDPSGLQTGEQFEAKVGTRLVLGRGTVDLSPGAAVEAVESSPSHATTRLTHGKLHARVHKLRSVEKFLIVTDDAEVEVRGTSFHVERTATCVGFTQVQVEEGLVEVRSAGKTFYVKAGETWPDCGKSATLAPIPTPIPPTADPVESPGVGTSAGVTPSAAVAISPRPLADVTKSSTLDIENSLFAKAIRERRAGNIADAAKTIEELLTKYPRTPLREPATIEQMRVYKLGNPGKASAVAKEYLTRYPKGSARAEAEELLK